MTRAIIVGSAGQDGRILYERLAREGCAVLGIARDAIRSSAPFPHPLIDITDAAQVRAAVAHWQPHAIYYLAAHHHSSQDPHDH